MVETGIPELLRTELADNFWKGFRDLGWSSMTTDEQLGAVVEHLADQEAAEAEKVRRQAQSAAVAQSNDESPPVSRKSLEHYLEAFMRETIKFVKCSLATRDAHIAEIEKVLNRESERITGAAIEDIRKLSARIDVLVDQNASLERRASRHAEHLAALENKWKRLQHGGDK